MLINILQCIGQPPQQTCSAPSVSGAELEKRMLWLFLDPGQHDEIPPVQGRQAARLEKSFHSLTGKKLLTPEANEHYTIMMVSHMSFAKERSESVNYKSPFGFQFIFISKDLGIEVPSGFGCKM